jgi:hypothetical protein
MTKLNLLADLTRLVKQIEADLRARCDEVPAIDELLKMEYDQARKAERTGVAFEEWRADRITQVAVAWVLSCVFVRFLEDNRLIDPPKIAGVTGHGEDRLQRARDEHEIFFRAHPTLSDRDYLLAVFAELRSLPACRDLFDPAQYTVPTTTHAPLTTDNGPLTTDNSPHWLSGDAAQKLIEFFQKIDTDGTGEILYDFADPDWDTRFLGDLYQDLSEAARKKYALLQTPVFVEEFILDRTLEKAIQEFGLGSGQSSVVRGKETTANGQLTTDTFRMIDPACGSGHFLLGAFARILKHWRAKEPASSDRELVNRALASVHGVDLNPYAVAVARFRLLLAAMQACGTTRLADAPAFRFNLACGDSLYTAASVSRCWATTGPTKPTISPPRTRPPCAASCATARITVWWPTRRTSRPRTEPPTTPIASCTPRPAIGNTRWPSRSWNDFSSWQWAVVSWQWAVVRKQRTADHGQLPQGRPVSSARSRPTAL